MSTTDRETITQLIPREWHAFIESGEYTGTRASIRADGSEVPVDFAARLEFVDERRIAIHVALAEDAPRSLTPTPALTQLTRRERAVIALIAVGRETRQIADLLHVSPETVRSHVRNSMSKVGAHTRAQLVALVMSGGDAFD
ncbi:MAG TPA: helix-turn-helix transcriptional regulator [Solirubrobacteraceae bacterium]|jgi:DNA-binding CsgD family transcriptional regulator|nr:helix-turn-helix transcriptional regulator [Solirubrobacteraceae bacterium]